MSASITVITCSHNRPWYLYQAIESIQKQTATFWEHLIFDDASTNPDVEQVLVSAAQSDIRVHVTTWHDQLGRPAAAWNKMLRQARGKYITILDDDNLKRPDFIAKMIAPMEADETVEAVSCGWTHIDDTGKPTGVEKHSNLNTTLWTLWRDNTIDSNAIVFRRSVLEKVGLFDEILTTNEDWHFMIRLVRHCKMKHLEECLLEYRVHDDQASKRAIADGAHANWTKIRNELYSEKEQRVAQLHAEFGRC